MSAIESRSREGRFGPARPSPFRYAAAVNDLVGDLIDVLRVNSERWRQKSGRIGAQFAAEGPSSVSARAGMARLFLVSRLELVSFAVIVYLMVFKPGA